MFSSSQPVIAFKKKKRKKKTTTKPKKLNKELNIICMKTSRFVHGVLADKLNEHTLCCSNKASPSDSELHQGHHQER